MVTWKYGLSDRVMIVAPRVKSVAALGQGANANGMFFRILGPQGLLDHLLVDCRTRAFAAEPASELNRTSLLPRFFCSGFSVRDLFLVPWLPIVAG